MAIKYPKCSWACLRNAIDMVKRDHLRGTCSESGDLKTQCEEVVNILDIQRKIYGPMSLWYIHFTEIVHAETLWIDVDM